MAERSGPATEPDGVGADPFAVELVPPGERTTELELVGPQVAYEIVFDCPDRMRGRRLLQRVQEVVGPTWPVVPSEQGATFAINVTFPAPHTADRFFASDFYRSFCIEARRTCRSSVLVVPLGATDGSAG
jgi:hypothetical protein